MGQNEEVSVNGTLIWYYYVCPREAWLMGRKILPNESNGNIEIGRFLHQGSYSRQKKEISLGNIKIDILKRGNGELVVGEIKKSSKHALSARMQLLFYLSELKARGVVATGELLYPEERRKEVVSLGEEEEAELEIVRRRILQIIYHDMPPPPKKIAVCKNCAYRELCWS